jgi:hypothetical protein
LLDVYGYHDVVINMQIEISHGEDKSYLYLGLPTSSLYISNYSKMIHISTLAKVQNKKISDVLPEFVKNSDGIEKDIEKLEEKLKTGPVFNM